jgi:competence protein ComEC
MWLFTGRYAQFGPVICLIAIAALSIGCIFLLGALRLARRSDLAALLVIATVAVAFGYSSAFGEPVFVGNGGLNRGAALFVAVLGILLGVGGAILTHRVRLLRVLLLIAAATYPFAPRLARGELEATVIDVGQGDSILVGFPDGRTLLIDGGGSPLASLARETRRPEFDVGEQVVAPYLWERGLKRLDAVLLTHGHRDHLDGLFAVLDDFQVRELWLGREIASPGFRALEQEANRHGVSILRHLRGDSFTWAGVRGTFLWPGDEPVAEKAANNDSLVLRLEFREVTYLLTGDIERPVERELLARGDALHADFLKVGHHGSKTSTSREFLSAVTPRVAVISAGAENPYGHPSQAVLDEFGGSGTRLLRTDRDGATTVSTDGHSISLHTYAQDLPPW